MLKLVVDHTSNENTAIGYLSADISELTTFSDEMLGTARVVKSWDGMHQVECIVAGMVR